MTFHFFHITAKLIDNCTSGSVPSPHTEISLLNGAGVTKNPEAYAAYFLFLKVVATHPMAPLPPKALAWVHL